MNTPPEDFVSVSADDLRELIEACLLASGLDAAHSGLVARLLTECDLMGVHSHGLSRLPGYCRGLKEGSINPSPEVRVIKDETVYTIIDGGGGLGYYPMVRGTQMAVEKAKKYGVGIAAVRQIGHYGAAGIYTRICVDNGCIGFSAQGNLPEVFPAIPVATYGSPPMSFAFPAGRQPPVVVDFNTRLFSQNELDLFERVPAAFFKSLGLTLSSKLLGGALVGMLLHEGGCQRQEGSPTGGSGGFLLAIDVSHFVPPEAFAAEVDRIHRAVGEQMKPMPGYDRPLLPGAVEARLEEKYRREGIPIGRSIIERVEPVARDLGVRLPWSENLG